MKKMIVFDVNETLLDLKALDPLFKEVFGEESIRRHWFAQVLQTSLVATITGNYHDFGAIAGAALDMTALRQKIVLSDDDRSAILGRVRSLPPHADVRPGLDRLREAGFTLFTLTNSPPKVVDAQLENAGLSGYFRKALSVDAVNTFKPAAAVYRMAAREIGVDPGMIRLVAAHDWDVAGAMAAGCPAAFIARPGMVLNPLFPVPQIVGKDLIEVADRIIATDQ